MWEYPSTYSCGYTETESPKVNVHSKDATNDTGTEKGSALGWINDAYCGIHCTEDKIDPDIIHHCYCHRCHNVSII